MPVPTQGELFPPAQESPRVVGSSASPGPAEDATPVWLQRMSLVVLVVFCFYIGGLLAVIPWTARYWDNNFWLRLHPAVSSVLWQGWARGLLSGLGLIDIWIGISELLHYRDHRDAPDPRAAA